MFKIKSFYRSLLFCLSAGFIIFVCSENCSAAGITEDKNLTCPEFWISVTRDADKVILNAEQLKAFNGQIKIKSPSVLDLARSPDKIDGEDLLARLSDTGMLNRSLYCRGSLFTEEAKKELINELDLESLKKDVRIRYGIVVRRANIRSLPMKDGLFDTADDVFFDNLQESAADPSEPLLIMHESRSGDFLYVQMYNCRGWIASSDVAVTDRSRWLEYAAPDNFLVVTARNFFVPSGDESILYQMGSRILIRQKYPEAFIARIPRRAEDGSMKEERQIILVSDNEVHEGYMPYTRANIITECFKYYGAGYGWGGLMESEDCSGFVNDVYRVFGIYLPRNSGQQAKTAGQTTSFNGLEIARRQELITEKLSAGDVLCMKGHIMIYLGTNGGVQYAIHSLGSYTVHNADGSRLKTKVMKIVVSDLSLRTWSGPEHIEAFTNSVSFR